MGLSNEPETAIVGRDAHGSRASSVDYPQSIAVSLFVAPGVISHSMTAVGQPIGGTDLLIAIMNEDIVAAQLRDLLPDGADIGARDEAACSTLLIAMYGNRMPRLPLSLTGLLPPTGL